MWNFTFLTCLGRLIYSLIVFPSYWIVYIFLLISSLNFLCLFLIRFNWNFDWTLFIIIINILCMFVYPRYFLFKYNYGSEDFIVFYKLFYSSHVISSNMNYASDISHVSVGLYFSIKKCCLTKWLLYVYSGIIKFTTHIDTRIYMHSRVKLTYFNLLNIIFYELNNCCYMFNKYIFSVQFIGMSRVLLSLILHWRVSSQHSWFWCYSYGYILPIKSCS